MHTRAHLIAAAMVVASTSLCFWLDPNAIPQDEQPSPAAAAAAWMLIELVLAFFVYVWLKERRRA